jgi:hypothetical protein
MKRTSLFLCVGFPSFLSLRAGEHFTIVTTNFLVMFVIKCHDDHAKPQVTATTTLEAENTVCAAIGICKNKFVMLVKYILGNTNLQIAKFQRVI